MARERKPLIEPGSVLPTTDTLSRILERDRVSSGRQQPQAAHSPSSHPDEGLAFAPEATATDEKPPDEHITGNITSHISANTRSSEETKQRRNLRSSADEQSVTQQPGQQPSREDAQQQAQKMARSRPIPITLRMPEELNDWLDDYAHAHRKQGVKKQDLIARAVELLVIHLTLADRRGEENE